MHSNWNRATFKCFSGSNIRAAVCFSLILHFVAGIFVICQILCHYMFFCLFIIFLIFAWDQICGTILWPAKCHMFSLHILKGSCHFYDDNISLLMYSCNIFLSVSFLIFSQYTLVSLMKVFSQLSNPSGGSFINI